MILRSPELGAHGMVHVVGPVWRDRDGVLWERFYGPAANPYAIATFGRPIRSRRWRLAAWLVTTGSR